MTARCGVAWLCVKCSVQNLTPQHYIRAVTDLVILTCPTVTLDVSSLHHHGNTETGEGRDKQTRDSDLVADDKWNLGMSPCPVHVLCLLGLLDSKRKVITNK